MTASRKKGAQPANHNARTHGFYSDTFTEAEQSLVAAFVTDPTLDDELWAQRVLNRRLIVASNKTGKAAITTATLIKIAAALAIGTGRVARLLRDQQAMSSGTHDSLQENIDRALDEIGIERGVKL